MINQSKINDPRCWETWNNNGSVGFGCSWPQNICLSPERTRSQLKEICRKEDTSRVLEIVKYLQKNGLAVQVAGGATRGDRQYKDIDLLAKGSLEAVTDVMSGLYGEHARIPSFPEETRDEVPYEIEHLGGEVSYVNRDGLERFYIKAGNTIIDLNLEKVDDNALAA